jgi:ORF6N domain
MLDADLAVLYGVSTSAVNLAVRRNVERFPEDSAFHLSQEELANWRSQIVTSNPAAKMALRRPPYAFTQEGVAMLSSVLRSERAVRMNILIMRAFVRLREMIAANKDLAARIEKLEASQQQTASIIEVLVDDIEGIARKELWWSRRDLNPRPLRCERSALPAELLPHTAGMIAPALALCFGCTTV